MNTEEILRALQVTIGSMGRECPALNGETLLCKDCPIKEGCEYPDIQDIRDIDKMNNAFSLRQKITG